MTTFLRFAGVTIALTACVGLAIVAAGPILNTWPLPLTFLFGVGCGVAVLVIAALWTVRR